LTRSDIKSTAKITGLNWHTVKAIDKQYLQEQYAVIDFSKLRRVAIDEFSILKGHKYMTAVMDLDSRRIVYLGYGKGSDALEHFWLKIKELGIQIEAVSIDMSKAYIKSVTENSPRSKIVFDWFHIKKLANETLESLRRELYREEQYLGFRKVIKGNRWLLLKNSENLNTEKGEAAQLKEALKMNQPLSTMYYLKEELGHIWAYERKQEAAKFLKSWCRKAMQSGVPKIAKLGRTIASYRTGVLNWYDHPISNAVMEGTNNKIKVLKRKAYGFRDMEYFKLRIFDLHKTQLRYSFTR